MHFVTQEDRNEMFNTIIDLFVEGHPQSHTTSDTLFDHWSICAIYAPHIIHLQALKKQWKLQPRSTEKLWVVLFNCSRYLLETGAMAKCLTMIEEAEPMCDLATETGLLQIAYFYNARGLISLQHQQVIEGRKWFERAYDIRKKYLGENDVNTVAVSGNLSLTLLTERRWDDLISFNITRRKSFENGDQSQVPLRLSFAIYNLLALAYLETGLLDEAWENVCIASDMMKNHIAVFSQLNGYLHYNRGKIISAQGSPEKALREHYIGLNIRKQVLGDHIQTAASCYRTADLMDRTGKHQEAIDLLLESCRMYDSLGLIGSFTKGGSLRSTWRLAQIMRDQNRTKDEEDYREEVFNGRLALGLPPKDKFDLVEADFNILLNYADS
ncbi:hypothetical protein OCU04_002618 [Sclerotinia nivalis]|uniref:Uncharacterized protein n=1 Tax=Sclerotinia nivalis TaxID=352851 RepID=A0A9X0AU05_9HELO|nr:hypothetical protein OCU04_002618 [Sclerotinia nivalis]